jgi:hypothetical protein
MDCPAGLGVRNSPNTDTGVPSSTRKRSRREGNTQAYSLNGEQDENSCLSQNTELPLSKRSKEDSALALLALEQKSFDFSQIPNFSQDLVCALLSFLTTVDDVIAICSVCKNWNASMNDKNIWKSTPVIKANGALNLVAYQLFKKHNEGTEGICYKVRQRSTGATLAMRKPRVLPNQEGVPYYVLRELSVLKVCFPKKNLS